MKKLSIYVIKLKSLLKRIMVDMKKYYKYFYLLISILVGLIFFYISYKTPLAGDDWGYALNGLDGDVFNKAIEFYFSWSGRFFSELYGFVVTPNKWLWNIINPLLFVSIFILIYKISDIKNRYILVPLVILGIIISVDDQVRMETYSWLMGTTYVIALFMALVYLYCVDYFIVRNNINNNSKYLFLVVSNIVLFYIGLTLENIAAVTLLATIVIFIYYYFNKFKYYYLFISNIIFSGLSFLILRLSPGSYNRLLRDNIDWVNSSLFDKLFDSYPIFIDKTFYDNNYLLLFIGVVLVCLIIGSDKKIRYKIINSLLLVIGSCLVFVRMYIAYDISLFDMVYWVIYLVNILFVLYYYLNGIDRLKAMFLYMFSGSCNIVMLYSPIFGSRSSLYTIFIMIIVLCIVLDNIKFNRYYYILFVGLLGFVLCDRLYEYYYKYYLVGEHYQHRLEIIKYYQSNPDIKEVWIDRFPIFTLHSIDIEVDDIYHLETFKEYFNLPQEATDIIFAFRRDK